ncbi:30S ribosomal protein S9 [Candidatus Parcubacteria bacterium]|nr:MAG: 30S ribosomal protein S9 [Candidatus Parcubacteria bacterium]
MPPKKTAKPTTPRSEPAKAPASPAKRGETGRPLRPRGEASRVQKPASQPRSTSAEQAVDPVVPEEPREPITVGESAEGDAERSDRYWEAVGRRKTAIARARLYTKGDKGIWVNEKPIAEYFHYGNYQRSAISALETMNTADRFRTLITVRGGGPHAQAEAVRHATARALVRFNADFRKRLKRAGYLTRDARAKERKKFGLRGARRAPQWAKR